VALVDKGRKPMSVAEVGSMLTWMAGVTLGIGLMGSNYTLIGVGILLSVAGVAYINRFAGGAN
jgi:hypothetical protein